MVDKKIVAEQRIEVKDGKVECSDHGDGHTFYAVDISSGVNNPIDFHGELYGHDWKRAHFMHPLVTPDVVFYPWATSKGYYSYETAYALAAWVRAEAHTQMKIGLRVRLVEFTANWSCEFTKVAEFQPLYWRGRPKYEDDTDE